MSDVILSPNMSLPVPIVGVDPGPDWANNIDACLGILDQHDHTTGRGVPITPNGLNINADLPIQSNNLIEVKTVNFTPQLSFLPGLAPNLGCIYVAGNELYYNDEVGNVVAITNNGSVNAGAGSITGLPSGTASASYSAGGQKFTWQSATSTAAGMDNGPVTIREIVANAKGVTLNSPAALAADYSLFFPASLPGALSFMTLDTAGNIGTLAQTNGIATSMIQDHAVTQVKLGTINATFGTINPSGSASNGQVDIAPSVTITTTGRPVFIGVGPNDPSSICNFDAANQAFTYITTLRNSVQISQQQLGDGANTSRLSYPMSSFFMIDPVAPGTYTYQIQASTSSALRTCQWGFAQLIVYEL